MKFICLSEKCKRTFIYAAELSHEEPSQDVTMKRVCPFCGSLDFDEYMEPMQKLVSVVSVDIVDVDAKLKEGYEVKEIYSKNAVLIKKEKELK